jgi:hypothetical protein
MVLWFAIYVCFAGISIEYCSINWQGLWSPLFTRNILLYGSSVVTCSCSRAAVVHDSAQCPPSIRAQMLTLLAPCQFNLWRNSSGNSTLLSCAHRSCALRLLTWFASSFIQSVFLLNSLSLAVWSLWWITWGLLCIPSRCPLVFTDIHPSPFEFFVVARSSLCRVVDMWPPFSPPLLMCVFVQCSLFLCHDHLSAPEVAVVVVLCCALMCFDVLWCAVMCFDALCCDVLAMLCWLWCAGCNVLAVMCWL